jgi:hypothetical protein
LGLSVFGDGWHFLTEERIQEGTHWRVFNEADSFNQKVNFIKTEVIIKQ